MGPNTGQDSQKDLPEFARLSIRDSGVKEHLNGGICLDPLAVLPGSPKTSGIHFYNENVRTLCAQICRSEIVRTECAQFCWSKKLQEV